jgi:hypothetical protein
MAGHREKISLALSYKFPPSCPTRPVREDVSMLGAGKRANRTMDVTNTANRFRTGAPAGCKNLGYDKTRHGGMNIDIFSVAITLPIEMTCI